MDEDKRQKFLIDAIYLVPTWNMTHNILYHYLASFDTPMAKVKAILTSSRSDGINH